MSIGALDSKITANGTQNHEAGYQPSSAEDRNSTNGVVSNPPVPPGVPESALECQVCVVGAGPAGLMLATNLARFGIHVQIVDERSDQTSVGR